MVDVSAGCQVGCSGREISLDRQTVLQAPAQLGLAWPAESPRQGAYSLAARLIILERRMRRDIGMIGDLFVDFEGCEGLEEVRATGTINLQEVLFKSHHRRQEHVKQK